MCSSSLLMYNKLIRYPGYRDGTSSRQRSKKQYAKQSRTIKESASVNRDPMAHHIVPRTQRVPTHLSKPMTEEQFAEKLREKLEIVARERKTQEKLDKHLQEDDLVSNNDVSLETISNAHKTLGDALREKLSIEEDSDQAILDQHVSRVWSDLTPSRSPRLSSPRLHSPDRRRGPMHSYPRPYKQRKEKDVFSTFSVDSGNIHDFQEGSDLVGASSTSSLNSHLPKSKSVPSDYADSLHKQDLYLQGIQLKHTMRNILPCERPLLLLKLSCFVHRSRAEIPKVWHDKKISDEKIDDGTYGQRSECRQRRTAFHK